MGKKKISMQASIIWNSIGSMVYLATQWLITILVVRIAGVEAAGNFTLATSVNNVFYSIAMFGVRNYQVSDVNSKYDDGTYINSRMVSCCFSFLACVGYCICMGYNAEQRACVIVYCAFKMSEALYDVYAGICQKNWRMDFIGKSWMLRGVVTFIGFSVTLYFSSNLLGAILCMSILSFGITAIYDIPRTSKLADIHFLGKLKKGVQLMKECFPLFTYLILSTLVTTIPRIVLERISGSYALGIYGSVSAPTLIVQMGASYIFNPFLTLFAEQYSNKQKKDFWKTFKMCMAGIMALSVCALVGGKVLGRWGLNLLYGAEIARHVYLLIPLIVCTILTAIVWLLCALLTIVREFKGLIISNLIALIVSTISAVSLISFFDMQGTSYALSLSFLIEISCLYLFLKKKTDNQFCRDR